jgi:hypothetical protein
MGVFLEFNAMQQERTFRPAAFHAVATPRNRSFVVARPVNRDTSVART